LRFHVEHCEHSLGAGCDDWGKDSLERKGESAGEYYDYPQFSKDGRGVYVVTDRGSEWRRLAFVDLATKQHKYPSDHIKWDVEDFKVAPMARPSPL